MIEVKELVVKIEIQDFSRNIQKEKSDVLNPVNKKQLINECVEKVLEILESKMER